jgi:DNA-binding NarL/FixJ family response regulator
MTTSVLLVDDHEVVRQGLRALLEAQDSFSLAGEAGDGREALRLMETLHPDVVVLDLAMPGMSGLEVLDEIRRRGLHQQVLVLSMYGDGAYVHESMRRGAGGYVLKDAPAAELVAGVRAVAAGKRFLSSTLTDRGSVDNESSEAVDPYEMLTGREKDVLVLLARGLTTKEIAERLEIGPRTVETHRAHLIRKLGLRAPGDLVRHAMRYNLLPSPDRKG